jgi:hypothetical protein
MGCLQIANCSLLTQLARLPAARNLRGVVELLRHVSGQVVGPILSQFTYQTCPKEQYEIGWANIRRIFNIQITNIFDLLFEYSNIIRIFYVIFYNIIFFFFF